MISRRVEQLAAGASWLHRRAPEAKAAAFTLAALTVLTETQFSGPRMLAYSLLALTLILSARLPVSVFLRRCVLVSPFLLLAAAMPWLSRRLGEQGVAAIDPRLILAKGLLAVVLLTLLAASTPFAALLAGLERLRAPAVLRLLAGLMYRYVPLLREEWDRMELARRSRTPGEPRRRPLNLLGRQLANLFLRAWRRADRVQAAMESRAFTGRWPRAAARSWNAPDIAFLAAMILAAAFIRFSGVLFHAT